MPALLRNVDAVSLGIMDTILGERNSLRPRRAAAKSGAFRSRLHFFVVFDMKAKVIKPNGLFLALV